MNSNTYKAGLDIGSTTVKLIILNSSNKKIFSKYIRHNTDIAGTLKNLFCEISQIMPYDALQMHVTGSAGMGLAEKTNLPFIQETVAATEYVFNYYPDAKTLIDLGGEDSKMIFFSDKHAPDIRMNGNCAGGTGAFIDQMASLLNVSIEDLEILAANYQNIYPIASRCGVFAKTDVQNLISRKIAQSDIAASIYSAVAIQTLNTLARGCDVKPTVLFCGGPLTFLAGLRNAFIKHLKLNEADVVLPADAHFTSAIGAAIATPQHFHQIKTADLLFLLDAYIGNSSTSNKHLDVLFQNIDEYENWIIDKKLYHIPKATTNPQQSETIYIGIDSGSTTTKIIATNQKSEILFSFYRNNKGNSLDTAIDGLRELRNFLNNQQIEYKIGASAVTGYGEDLIKTALGIDIGMVETMAHYTAAKKLQPDVSFILDIGGQDMKAIYIANGNIHNLEINEACSSGCGSFIEGFAKTLNYTAAEFAELACFSKAPCELGTRCTVFMNSKVKQSLREGAKAADIAAGLAYSVIKNCLYKVLKIKNNEVFGNKIVVQGGSFKNHAILRALEKLTGKDIACSEMPEMMGAYGAAIFALENKENIEKSTMLSLENIETAKHFESSTHICKGCTNFCSITCFKFFDKKYYTGNKCEKIFTNKGEKQNKGSNIYAEKHFLLNKFCESQINVEKITIGIPRILDMYENLPFWKTLFSACNINTIVSSESNMGIYEKGLGTVMSDNICFPAKLAHGHVIELAEKGVNRIFYPLAIYQRKEDKKNANSYNCPIVSSYAEVLKSSINIEEKYGIPLDAPTINYNDIFLLKTACFEYLRQFNVSKSLFIKAFEKAVAAQKEFKRNLQQKCFEIYDNAVENNNIIALLAGRPYHTDDLIQHKTAQILTELGVDVISEEIMNEYADFITTANEVQTIAQWAYPNRIMRAAQWVAGNVYHNIHFIELNSFGCGPDAFILDEISDLLKSKGKNHTVIKVDEISSTGSVRLRLRSLIESIKHKNNLSQTIDISRKTTKVFEKADRIRQIIMPHFSDFHSPIIPPIFKILGYEAINLPPADKTSVDFGLTYANNEICFPATVIVGDIIKAMKSGKYNPNETAVGITQTGGQCRATNYISLIKKALVAAGYENVPVISIATGSGLLNEQPGFDLNVLKILKTTLVSILFADTISRLFYYCVVREKIKNKSKQLSDYYLSAVQPYIAKRNVSGIFTLLKQAVQDFNNLELIDKQVPKIGIVGEIYVKLNPYGNANVVNWLVNQGVEVVVPPLIDFMIQGVVNSKVNKNEHLERKEFSSILNNLFEHYLNFYIRKVEKIYAQFKHATHTTSIQEKATKAEKIVDLANQFGEGWLIPAEICCFAEEGINHVVSLQPFGCIANHVISKGVEAKIKRMYPKMNLLFLDFDSGTSEVNILNRLYFLMKNASDQAKEQTQRNNILLTDKQLKFEKIKEGV